MKDELFDIEKVIQESINQLSKYTIELGVISGTSTKRKALATIGVTNAELMYIHENGSLARHIPARPVLQITLNYAVVNLLPTTLDKCINICLINGFNESMIMQELNKLCMRIESYARHIIYDNTGVLAPNAPSVIARKGDNHPLFDTGQLARSIVCRIVKN